MKSKDTYFSLRSRLILIVYPLVFIISWFFAWQSIKMTQSYAIANAYDTALNEQFRIGYAIKKMAENQELSTEEEKYFLLGTVRNVGMSYAEYYDSDASYRILNNNNDIIYSNMEDTDLFDLSPEKNGNVSYTMKTSEGKTFILVSSYVKIYHDLFRLDYAEDITGLKDSIINLSKKMSLILFTIEIIILITLYFIIKKSLKPLNNLKQQAIAISNGNYDLRTEIVHNDEIGELGRSFNIMAASIEEHIETLSETARMKELFASDLAHEIKTPITSIVAYSDYAMRTDIEKEKLYEILDYMKREGQRLSGLSDKILKWNSITNSYQIDIKPCRPERIINQSIHSLNPLLTDKNIDVENRVRVMYGDEVLLISLIINLCKNSLNASEEGQSVNLQIENDLENNLIIKVIDNGSGVASNELNKIQEPFYMVDKSRDRGKGGSGLGLSLCNTIVKAHNGKMDIRSKLGEGTEVQVVIPQSEFTNP